MVFFFFYGTLAHQIAKNHATKDGYVLVHQYDPLSERFEIKDTSENNLLLHGKIVQLNLKQEEVLEKIKETWGYDEIQPVWCSQKTGGVYKAYIVKACIVR